VSSSQPEGPVRGVSQLVVQQLGDSPGLPAGERVPVHPPMGSDSSGSVEEMLKGISDTELGEKWCVENLSN